MCETRMPKITIKKFKKVIDIFDTFVYYTSIISKGA